MSEEPVPREWSVPALIISVVVAGLLGLSAGFKMDDSLRSTLGTIGAAVVGFGTALLVWVGVAVVSYRGLTR